ncbi:MAG: hypothetical protein JWR46_375, partial [Mycobacterium sp.]|nr:hypothetical protein [Mycobacterium sp.]
MGDGIKVDTADLRAKANQVENVQFGDADALASGLAAPDELASTKAAMNLLQMNANYLSANQKYGEAEGRRLAETLRSVGDAYDEFDEAARKNLDGTGPPPAPVAPKGNSIPEPALPAPLGAPSGSMDEEALHVDVAQQKLSAGDSGRSLEGAKFAWDANGANLQKAATTFQTPIRNWEGEAADEAYGKFFEYGLWLTKLGQSWQKLSQEAHRIVDAHLQAIGDHTPV